LELGLELGVELGNKVRTETLYWVKLRLVELGGVRDWVKVKVKGWS
jgi:hypothetical protein